jgi:hypothetical protein
MSTTTSAQGGLVNKYLPGSMNGYQVFANGGSLCAWYFRDASNYVWDGSACSLATPGFNDGEWHHVAFVVDASGGRLFVDGTLRRTQPWTGTPGATTTTQGLSFAQYPGAASSCLAGRLDDVRIYNRALSADDVSSLVGTITPSPSPDATPPVMTAIGSVRAPNGDQIVSWTTDEPSDSQVEYGPTTAYGFTTNLDASRGISHAQTLTGLVPGTLYYYRVRSRDQAGNLSVSRRFGFFKKL